MELTTEPYSMDRLSDRIYQVLRREMLSGKLAPSQHLSVTDIAQRLGVSTTPVRDALRLLVADHLVEWRPRRGAFVTQLSPSLYQEIYQVREFLECAAVDYVLQQGPAPIAQMQGLVEQMAEADVDGSDPDPLAYAKLDQRFHAIPIDCVGNHKLSEIYAELSSVILVALTLWSGDPARARQAGAGHQAIVDALRHGDAEAARARIRAHLRNTRAEVLRRLSQPGNGHAV